VLLYVSRIGDSLGWQAPLRLFFYLIGSGIVLTYLRRPIVGNKNKKASSFFLNLGQNDGDGAAVGG